MKRRDFLKLCGLSLVAAAAGIRSNTAKAESAPAWADGAWAAYQPKGAASFADSLRDVSGNGRRLWWAPGTPPSWSSADGWTFYNSQILHTVVYDVDLTDDQLAEVARLVDTL